VSSTIPGISDPTIASITNTPYAPYPHEYGAAHVGDVDDRYETFVPMLQKTQLNDVIVGLPIVVIARVDGTTMGAQDMQVKPNSITVDPTTQQIVYWWFQNCLIPNVIYWVNITVQTQNGRTLTRTGYIAVLPQLG
jgi:hypothetical protein